MKILRNISTLTLATVLLVQLGFRAQNVSAQTEIKARARGRKLVLTSRGKSHVLDVSESVGAARLEDASVLFATRRGDFTYLLVSACGSSKAKPDARQCGAGTECNLLWLKLNAGWQMSEIKSALYESCWLSITSTDGYKVSGNRLSLEYDNFSKKVNAKLTYNADEPESGFLVEESPLKDTD
jgi:hypothetical protein